MNPRRVQQLDVRNTIARAKDDTGAFTPGPWRVGLSPVRATLCVVSADTWICGELQCGNNTAIPASEAEANASLIAAAPDLLDLLRQYRNDMVFPNLDEGQRARRIEAIDAAIARAEGRAG